MGVGSTRRGPDKAGHRSRGGWLSRVGSDTGRGGRCVHGKVNMVSSRGTCTLLPSHRGRGSEVGGVGAAEPRAAGEGVRTVCALTYPRSDATPTRPWNPGCSAALRRAMLRGGLLSSTQAKGEPCDPRTHGILVFLSTLAVWTWAGKRPCLTPTLPLTPHSPTRPKGARPQDSSRGCQGDIFSGTARFQRPPPAQLAGSFSTFLQTGSPAVTGCEAARGLGESSAYGGALAGASRPGVLGCFNPARLATGWALPCLNRPPTFPAVSF